MKNIFILLFLFFLFSCEVNTELKDNDQLAREALVGVWRGSGEYQDEQDRGWNEFWKMVRRQDGSYDVSYLLVHDGNKQYERSADSGKWSYRNGRYFETDQWQQKSVFNVISLKKDIFVYNHIERGDGPSINEAKTGDGYQLQDPPTGYVKFEYQPSDKLNQNNNPDDIKE